jgi:GNAT superfamily N-acetyltransferase
MEYRLYPLEDQSRLDEICTLFAKGLAETTPEYWKWKHFFENGQPEGMILVAEAEDGSFAGMFALQPEHYGRGNSQITVIQNEDLVIDPAHRGTGLMKRLYRYALEYYREQGAVGSVSFCNAASYPIFLKYGAEDRGDIYTCNTDKHLLPIYLNRTGWKKGAWEIRIGDQMPDDLFYPVNEEAYQLRKSDAFMKWKFVDNPDGPFRWLTIRNNGKLMGYMVTKIVQGKFRRAVNIYDWALRDELPDEMLRAAVKLLHTHGNWVSLWGRYSDAVLDRWARAGLAQKNEQGTHFVLHTFGDTPMPAEWHVTRADLDY